MDDHPQVTNSSGQAADRAEPVRSRWTPKPEQILILESIFNSGMVNPPKDETVRIRKLLEKFGSVGDANVFYWFQNRRSRSRRRQRQMQAGLTGDQRGAAPLGGGAIQYESGFGGSNCFGTSPSSFVVGGGGVGSCSSSRGAVGDECVDELFSVSGQMGVPEMDQSTGVSSILCPQDTSNLHYQPGFISVFINGVSTEVPRGPIDMKAMFGEDLMLVHSSGAPVHFNEFGFSVQSLQHGESYFLVIRRFKTCLNWNYQKAAPAE